LIGQKIQVKKIGRVILLGDYIDRGNQSIEVIDFIIDLLGKGFDIIPLLEIMKRCYLKHFQTGTFYPSGFKIEV
jgi:serine/threonine protein phosphatase 1